MIAFLLSAAIGLVSTPEGTLGSFVDAFNRRDVKAMAQLVVGGKAGQIPFPPGAPKLRVIPSGKAAIVGPHATMQVKAGTTDLDGEFEYDSEPVEFQRIGSVWKIVPIDPPGGIRSVRTVDFMGYVVIRPEKPKPFKTPRADRDDEPFFPRTPLSLRIGFADAGTSASGAYRPVR